MQVFDGLRIRLGLKFKKNLIEFLLDLSYYLYKYLLVYVLVSCNHKILTNNYIVLHNMSMLFISLVHCIFGYFPSSL